jgi:hypothetical protein
MDRRTNMKKLMSIYAATRTRQNNIAVTVQYKTAKPLLRNTIVYFKLANKYLQADAKWI